jgi:hypothetical protein
MRTLKRQIAGVKGIEGKEVVIDLVDNREDGGGARKNVILKFDEDGELVSTRITDKPSEVTENFQDNVKIFLACTILATGAVSCTKDDDGFGYNVGSRATEYTLDAGTPNKKITISTPWGEEEHEVDSNLADTKYYTGGQGLKVGRPITPTEARILQMGHAFQTERNQNNKKGTPSNKRWDYNPDKGTFTGGGNYYKDARVNFKTVRDHPLFNLGLNFGAKLGEDMTQLMRDADEEVKNQKWVK